MVCLPIDSQLLRRSFQLCTLHCACCDAAADVWISVRTGGRRKWLLSAAGRKLLHEVMPLPGNPHIAREREMLAQGRCVTVRQFMATGPKSMAKQFDGPG